MENLQIENNRIDTSFNSLDEALSSTRSIRDTLIDKLHKAAESYDFSIENSSPENRESFMSVINSLEGLLKGKERAALDNVKLSLIKRAENDNHDMSEHITKMLKQISPGFKPKSDGTMKDEDTLTSELKDEFTASNLQISDGELEEIDGGII